MQTYEDWKTDQMIQAERGLDDSVEQAYREMYAADDLLDRIAADDERRATEWAQHCRDYAHRDDVSSAWKNVIAKVARGELTWHDIASGNAMDDPALRTAIADDQRQAGTATDVVAESADDEDEDSYYSDFDVYGNRKG
jgi:hypothetical protein